jgi:hypothetical protein
MLLSFPLAAAMRACIQLLTHTRESFLLLADAPHVVLSSQSPSRVQALTSMIAHLPTNHRMPYLQRSGAWTQSVICRQVAELAGF